MNDPRREAYAGAITDHLWGAPDQIDDATTAVMRIADTEHQQATDGELRRQLQAAIRALGKSETELAQLREAARWIRRNYPALHQVNDRLATALDEPAGPHQHDGPTVAEAREADRRWPLQKHGE